MIEYLIYSWKLRSHRTGVSFSKSKYRHIEQLRFMSQLNWRGHEANSRRSGEIGWWLSEHLLWKIHDCSLSSIGIKYTQRHRRNLKLVGVIKRVFLMFFSNLNLLSGNIIWFIRYGYDGNITAILTHERLNDILLIVRKIELENGQAKYGYIHIVLYTYENN